MSRFVLLFHRFILRDLGRNRSRALLTVTGVALGISVVAGVRLANDRAIGSFNDSLRILSGRADLQIAANGLPLDENLIGELSWVWDVGAMTAVIEGRLHAESHSSRLQEETPPSGLPEGADPLRLFGIDLLSDAPFRTYTVREQGRNRDLGLDITREDFIDLLVEPDAIIIPAMLAERWNVRTGGTVSLLAANRWRTFTVRGILTDEGVASAFGGQVVFMDVAAAQLSLDRIGEIDRIELILDDPEMADAVADRIRVQLPPSTVVYRPDDAQSEAETMTRAFRYNLTALSYIALAVGIVLIYNTLNIAVVRRRREIGALRTLGAGRRTIQSMFLIEAALFGIVGAFLGIWAGEFLARAAGALVSRTISTLYTGAPASAAGGIDAAFFFEMILLGGLLAAVSGMGPAMRAMSVSPADALRESLPGTMPPFVQARTLYTAGAGALLLGAGLSFAPAVGPAPGFPFFGYAAGILFIAGFCLLAPLLARLVLRAVRRPVIQMLPAEGRLAVQTIEGRLNRVIVAVVSLTIAVAMLASVAIMVASFRETVIVWMNQTLRGDLYIRPAASGADGGRNVLHSETLDVLGTVPEIDAVDRFRSLRIEYGGLPAVLAAGEFQTLSTHSGLLFTGGRSTPEVASRLIGSDRVVVSEPFAVRHGIKAGDTVRLPAPDGFETLEVEAIFYDYSTETGMVVMDRSTFLAKFGDSSVSNAAVYLSRGADADAVRAEIARRLPGLELRIATNRELREQVLRVFDQTFEITYALQFIALAVAMLGVANTLAALVLERAREFSMLRFAGASRKQIRRVIVLESGLVGVLGSVIGLVLGFILSLLLIHVINFQSFGWTIQFAAPAGFLIQAVFLVLFATVAAGFYPASLALKLDPIQGIREE